MNKKLQIGIVGACGRGMSFKAACDASGEVEIRAVCDINEKDLADAAAKLGASEQYTDYETMLSQSCLDAVIVSTPMPLHVPQVVSALNRNLHVLCEVPAAVSVEECRQLVNAASKSEGVFMMAENYTYTEPNVIVREMVRRGLFGTPYYAEGEYIHELKEMNEVTKWRRYWQTGIDGITYGTHSLGPILQWMPGDRVESVCCVGSGHHYHDPRGDQYENQDTCLMLCQMVSGGLVKIRVDMLSDRPHATTNYQLQGTDGCYESARTDSENGRIWLRSLSSDTYKWFDFNSIRNEYLPDYWKIGMDKAKSSGHGGGDYFEIIDFINTIHGIGTCPIGVHEAMDMTLPGLISQQSIREGGRWLTVPDSRTWHGTAKYPTQLQMLWPEDQLTASCEVKLPQGYHLRCLQTGEEDAHVALMRKAGFSDWTRESLSHWQHRILPGGHYVIEHASTHTIVASAMAAHGSCDQQPYGGELSWVAADPDHSGKRLGEAISTAVVRHFIRTGYRRIYLKTDDFRLPAILTYLRLGFRPIEYDDEHADRWKRLREALSGKL